MMELPILGMLGQMLIVKIEKFYEESIEKPESLAEYLWEQLSFVVTTEEEYDIGKSNC